jgi:hypothetical protein
MMMLLRDIPGLMACYCPVHGECEADQLQVQQIKYCLKCGKRFVITLMKQHKNIQRNQLCDKCADEESR